MRLNWFLHWFRLIKELRTYEILGTLGFIPDLTITMMANWDPRYCLQMPVLASCILFLSIVRKKEVKHELACLGIACGYFGHLAMSEADTPGLFHEINQLNTLAFQHINRTRTILDPMLETANLGVDQATVTSSNAIDFTDMSEGLGSMFDFTDISLDFSSDTLDISQGF